MDWFYCYNHGEQSLLSNMIVKHGYFPVCKDINGRKSFTTFRSALNLYNYLLKLNEEERCLYEVIRGESLQKPYFDIDMHLNADDGFLSREDKLAIAEQIPSIIEEAIMRLRPMIKRTDIMVLNSHSKEKISFHIIVARWCFVGCRRNKKFFEQVLEMIPDRWKIFFDQSMYKPVQQFRMYMCTKYGSNRHKRLDPIESHWEIDEHVLVEHENFEIFCSSLITHVKGCEILDMDLGEDSEKGSYIERECSTDDISRAVSIISKMPYSNCFRVEKVESSLIVVRRILPSKCKPCSEREGYEKIHENENPFIYITISGDVCFDCRREVENKL